MHCDCGLVGIVGSSCNRTLLYLIKLGNKLWVYLECSSCVIVRRGCGKDTPLIGLWLTHPLQRFSTDWVPRTWRKKRWEPGSYRSSCRLRQQRYEILLFRIHWINILWDRKCHISCFEWNVVYSSLNWCYWEGLLGLAFITFCLCPFCLSSAWDTILNHLLICLLDLFGLIAMATFASATENFVKNVDSDGNLIPVSSLNNCGKLNPLSLVLKQSPFFMKTKYTPTKLTLDDVFTKNTPLNPGKLLMPHF